MSEFQAILANLGANTERVLRQIAQRLLTGELDPETFADLGAMLIARSNSQGHYLAEQRLAALLSEITGQPPGNVLAGLPLNSTAADTDRLAAALRTASADPTTTLMRVGRLARAEPIQTGQQALGRAMAKRSEVIGWRRGIEPDACELCQWLEHDGRLYEPEKAMHAHTGCECVQIPVTGKQYERQWQSGYGRSAPSDPFAARRAERAKRDR